MTDHRAADTYDATLFIATATGSISEATDTIRDAGQRELTHSSMLPTESMDDAREILEAAGVVFREIVEGNRLFTHVTLPYGWSITPDGSPFWQPHHMHSFLRDGLSRHRARLVICTDWWDRSAELQPEARYSVHRYYHHKGAIVFKVYDGIRPLFATEPRPYTEAQRGTSEYYDMEATAKTEAKTWLTERYPDWKNPAAYWN